MKVTFSHISMAKLCGWFGITRQAYYQHNHRERIECIEANLIIKEVISIREKHPRMGTRKLHKLLGTFMVDHSIKMGRDALFDLLSAHQLLIKKHRRRIATTNSLHWYRKYPNLIKDFIPSAPNQLWVSDITYWKINTSQHLYISFITDAYSHRIMGHHVATTLETVESIKALQMALFGLGPKSHLNLIHHSDRGIQYCSCDYVQRLQDHKILISMTQNGDPLENPIAERVNGIIKEEYLAEYKVNNIKDAKDILDRVVRLYNQERPHLSIGNFTPDSIHFSPPNTKPQKLWKNYYRKSGTLVNQLQDKNSIVNLKQDLISNL